MNSTFNEILEQKIKLYRYEFSESSEIFLSPEGLKKEKAKSPYFHSGEFGGYREAITKRFLSNIVPQRYSIGDGFILNKEENGLSTQCDIVIYDHSSMPLIENDYKQKFFTIESTLGVGEIKSNLTISQLKKSLENLKNIKQLRLKTNDKWIKKTTQDFRIKKEGIIKNGDSFYVRTEQNNKFDSNDPFDQIFTFIICKDFDTKLSIKKILTLIRDMKGRDKGFGINSILSLNKGLLCYNSSAFSNNRPEFTWIPFMNNKIAEPIFLKNKEENNDHIKAFCAFVYEAISGISLFHTQMTNYFSFNIDVDQVINLP